MDLITSSVEWIYSAVVLKALPFLFVLTVIVFVHEMGHFLVARWCGVKVDVFSVGFGREIFGFTDNQNTRWKLSWIPLGGYVKFAGDMSAASTPDREVLDRAGADDRKNMFHNKSLAQRAAVVAAGPIANFLLSIMIFALTVMIVGKVITSPLVDEVRPGSAAAEAGFQAGDLVTAIDGEKIDEFSDLQRIVATGGGAAMKFEVERNGKKVTINAAPKYEEVDDGFGNKVRRALLGISRKHAGDSVSERYGPIKALGYGVDQTWFIIKSTFTFLYGVIAGREDVKQLGGPVKILDMSSKVAEYGITALVGWIALLSVSIGLINLFPIPILDGGHLLYYAIEAVRGKPLSAKMQDFGFRVGMAFILMLMLFVTYNDVRPKIDIF
ncbi:MAG: RIP metalloprotease RseP [Hyphomicrobiales bacterium]